MKLLLLLSLFVFNSPAQAATLDCLAYSKKFEAVIETSSRGAVLAVGRSSDRSTYGLTSGEVIKLLNAGNRAPGWLKFEGRSVRGQVVLLSVLAADLAGPAKPLRASLLVSSDWSETTEVAHQLDCQRK